MKSMFKKFLATFLGFLMFLFPAPRASAQIEVVEFSDASRLIRFKKEDLQDMVDHYLSLESYAKMVRERTEINQEPQNPDYCKDPRYQLEWLSLFPGFCIFITGAGLLMLYLIRPDPDALWEIYVGIPTLLVGLIVMTVTCCCRKSFCFHESALERPRIDRSKERHAREIKDILIKEKVNIESILGRKLPHGVLAADESQPLLQSNQDIPEYFLLFERPEDKVNFDPKPFFTTDRDTSYSQSLRSNRLAGLIRNVAGQLRARGARIKTRYHVTRVGSELPKVHIDDPRVMPEVDSVEVVVDRADA